ncbi:TetR/AcrR family transcriptional regulator [Microbispora sp. ATCC PTA-5024]|uniref:TetR/AcrR family transcriptional regulator n=1 Tax=Microbispora sp. ATCC PTA-5024 TaxID=316330 RepID=UPI0003DD7C85|nr:TetR/AcrR family transcriptional regulator [Microbispora sp. ATCC PTA-5024]ETK34197.1 TetR family transcriptional regulator [Microbispora sp. ATCC PTA-5024]
MTAETRPLRRDAVRNREALLAAAREVLAERGADAPLEAVARRAGVAIGTLYRHFPARADLVDAILLEKLRTWAAIGREAAAAADPWEAFVHYLRRVCETQAGDRAFEDLACRRVLEGKEAGDVRAEVYRLTTGVIDRARAAGRLRTDFTLSDLSFVVWGASRVHEMTASVRPGLWRRHLELILDALRAENAHDLSEPPLGSEELAALLSER